MSIVVSGGAGFIGVNLVRALVREGQIVHVLDNLSRGSERNLAEFGSSGKVHFHAIELSDHGAVTDLLGRIGSDEAVEEVWHLAANSDIPAGLADPGVDLKDTFLTTFCLVNAMKACGIGRLLFASTSAIYGDLGEKVLTEDAGPLFPISNYGAMKLASEALISAAAESHLEQVFLFRFPNVIGVPATHGVLLDFARKLKKDPLRLEVLGDGTQQKGYLHVSDLVSAMFHLKRTVKAKLSVHNIGAVDSGVTVRHIAEEMVALAAPGARLEFGTGNKGWVGDVPKFQYSVKKLLDTGWRPSMNSFEAMKRAMREVAAQEGLV
jgi:UDP-glucose 4-epimerase